MEARSGLEGNYRAVDSLKRRRDVLARIQEGEHEKRIATDLGITVAAVRQIAERLRADGELTG